MKNQTTNFPHHRLDVYRLALDMARLAKQLADRVPRGYRSFADHLLRAAGQTVLLTGEGANRYGAGQKKQRFTEARGECGETASAAELLLVLALVPKDDAHQLMTIADRIGAMLTRLIKRHS